MPADGLLEHDKQASNFKINRKVNLNLLGKYTITLDARFRVPLDNFGAYDEFGTTITFQLTVNPCEISSFVGTPSVTELIYNMLDSSLQNVASFFFTQTDSCEYVETYSISQIDSSVAPFVTLNKATKDFTISQFNDVNLIGNYNIEVKAVI